MARGVELPVPLEAVAIEIDVGNVVPDTHERRVADGSQRRIHLPVGNVRGDLERRARAGPGRARRRRLGHREAAKEEIAARA